MISNAVHFLWFVTKTQILRRLMTNVNDTIIISNKLG